MIRGQILHDKLDKDAGFPTHRLHSAIRDAVTSGRADESQGRRWALINKQANTGKHQSVIEGPVADGNDPKGDSVRSTASGVSGTEALLAKEAEDELTGNSVFLLSLANSLTVPSEVDVDQMHIVAFNAIFGNDGEEVDDSNLEFANGGIGAGTQVAFSDCVGSPLTDDENSHEDFQSSYPPFSGYCAFDGSDFSAFSGTSIEEGGSEHNHVENDKDVFAEDPDENKLPAEDTADENVLHDKTEKNKVFIEESVENPPCSLHADLHDGLDSATLRWADVVLDNNLHDKFENGSHVEKVTSLDDANEILHDEDLHEKVNGAEDKLHENIKIKPGTWTHAQIESIVAAPWRRRRRGSFTPLQLQHFDIAASDSSGDRPQEPTSPPGQFNFYTKPGFGIKDLLVDGMQYGHGDGTLPLDDDSRDDGQEISNSLETSILHDNDSNGMHDEILHEGMHDPAVLTKIETLMHGNENEMHDHELSNFHALHGKDKDIGADDSAALHGDSLHDADTNNSHGKKKEGFVNPDPVGFGRGGESRFYEEPDENAEKEGFVNPDPVGFGRGGEEKVCGSFGSDLHGQFTDELHVRGNQDTLRELHVPEKGFIFMLAPTLKHTHAGPFVECVPIEFIRALVHLVLQHLYVVADRSIAAHVLEDLFYKVRSDKDNWMQRACSQQGISKQLRLELTELGTQLAEKDRRIENLQADVVLWRDRAHLWRDQATLWEDRARKEREATQEEHQYSQTLRRNMALSYKDLFSALGVDRDADEILGFELIDIVNDIGSRFDSLRFEAQKLHEQLCEKNNIVNDIGSRFDSLRFETQKLRQQLCEKDNITKNLQMLNSRLMERSHARPSSEQFEKTETAANDLAAKAEKISKLEHDAQTPGKIQLAENSGNSGKTRKRNKRGRNNSGALGSMDGKEQKERMEPSRTTPGCAENPSSAPSLGNSGQPRSEASCSKHPAPIGPLQERATPGCAEDPSCAPLLGNSGPSNLFEPYTIAGKSAANFMLLPQPVVASVTAAIDIQSASAHHDTDF